MAKGNGQAAPTAGEIAKSVRKAVFYFEEYTTALGHSALVERWSMRDGIRMSGRILEMQARLNQIVAKDGHAEAPKRLMETASELVISLIRDTIHWTDDEMERLEYHDFVTLADLMVSVCLTHEERPEDQTGSKIGAFVEAWVLPALATGAGSSVQSTP